MKASKKIVSKKEDKKKEVVNCTTCTHWEYDYSPLCDHCHEENRWRKNTTE